MINKFLKYETLGSGNFQLHQTQQNNTKYYQLRYYFSFYHDRSFILFLWDNILFVIVNNHLEFSAHTHTQIQIVIYTAKPALNVGIYDF